MREPLRRSLFPLGEPSLAQPPPRNQQVKDRAKKQEPRSLLDDDAIELMPQLSRQHGRQESEVTVESDEPERMVIRKEVGYSIQYEYGEARQREQGPSKKSSPDAMAYV